MENQDYDRLLATLREIAHESPNKHWTERDLHAQVKDIIDKARIALYGTKILPKVSKLHKGG